MNQPPSQRQGARGRPHRAGKGSEREGGWEQIWQGDGEGQAAIVAGALESRGIPTRVHGYQPMPQAYPGAWGRNNWGILVPRGQAAAARAHLRDSGEEANVVHSREGLGRDQVFVLKLAAASLVALLIASAIGVLFYDVSL